MNIETNKTQKNSRIKAVCFSLVMLMLLSIGSASAQSYVGVRGGYGVGNGRFLPANESRTVLGLLSGGVSYKYFSDTRFVGAIEADLQYFERAFKYDLAKDSDSSYMRQVNSIDLPIMWHPHIYVFNRSGRVFFNLGVNFTYNISSYEVYESKENGIYSEGNYPFVLIRDNQWGYGLVGGVGISFLVNRFEFIAEGRYYYGYSDILKNYNVYPDNPMRSPLDNINISLGISYRLGKGGIKALPSKKYIQTHGILEPEMILEQHLVDNQDTIELQRVELIQDKDDDLSTQDK